MRALVADDDRASAMILAAALRQWKLDVTIVHDGGEAWEKLAVADGPSLAILDWEMPTLQGPEVCRRVRKDPARSHLYLVLLTSRNSREHVVQGMEAGADDYLVKPFDPDELRVRVQSGIRVITLQDRLAERVAELETALTNVKTLRGLLPICSYCKKVRSDDNYWEQVDHYVADHSGVEFTHGICPSCSDKVLSDG